MDLIKYSSELLSLNLSAYKFSIFSLLISIHNKSKVENKEEKLFYAEILYHFINRNTDINSKSLLISEIKNEISSKISEINKNLVHKEQTLTNNLITFLNENLANIKTLNDLFSFFKQNLSFLKEITLPENYNINGEEEIEKNIPIYNIEGVGIIDIYIKKCLLSFKRLSFPKLIKLYEDIIKFTNDKILANNIENLSIKEREYHFSEIFNNNTDSFFNSEVFFGESEKNEENFEKFSELENSSVNDDSSDDGDGDGNVDDPRDFYGQGSKDGDYTKKLNHRLFLMHKFYDYHLKYLYNDNSTTNQTKLHYCLLYLTNLYYDCGYYEHALQILFECVKLSQSNCDHEALLKCFLWLSIIYIQKGNYNLASQCLKTCLIKSFQNNYQLLYLISSIELSNLNFIFGASVGIKSENQNFGINSINYNNLEEKIISHSNDFEHLLNNIADYFSINLNNTNNGNQSGNQNNEKNKDWLNSIDFNEAVKNTEDINKLICYTNMHQVIDYILQGRYSLCIVYLKIIVKELFEEKNSSFNYKNKKFLGNKINNNNNNKKLVINKNDEKIPIKEFDSELIFQLTNLIISIMEYDFDFCSKYLLNILNLNKTLSINFNFNLINGKIKILSILMLNKYLSQNQFYHYHDIINTKNNSIIKSLGVYYSFVFDFYNYVHKFNDDENLHNIDTNYNTDLLSFIDQCKEYHFNSIYKKASILLVKTYIDQSRYTEAMQILSPMIYYNDSIDNNNNNLNNNFLYDNDYLYNNMNMNINMNNHFDENDFQISKGINVIEYNIHDYIVGILYQSYLCEKNEMYSKSEYLLNKIKNNIDIYCSIEEKYDFYYLYTKLNKNYFYIKELLKYAVMLNNEKKIENILEIMKEIKYKDYDKIKKDVALLIEDNHKLIEYANKFNFSPDGAIEILYSINNTNNNFIKNL